MNLPNTGSICFLYGKFKPTYYEFFDDDIVYDSDYIGLNELQSEIQTRIKETVRTKTQHSFSGVETQMKRNVELVRSGKEKNLFSDRFLQTPEKHYSLTAPLGTSDIASDKNPSWNVQFLRGQISKTVTTTTGSFPTQFTPRITVEPVFFETFVSKTTDISESEINVAAKKFDDGTFIQIQDDFILIDIKEENTPLRVDNFDIEV